VFGAFGWNALFANRARDVTIIVDDLPEALLHRERAVAVPELETEAAIAQPPLHANEMLENLVAEQTARRRVDGDAGEVVSGGVAYVKAQRRVDR
jgi:hypothetical protein